MVLTQEIRRATVCRDAVELRSLTGVDQSAFRKTGGRRNHARCVVWLGLALLPLVTPALSSRVSATADDPESAAAGHLPPLVAPSGGGLECAGLNGQGGGACLAQPQPGVPPATVGLRVLAPVSAKAGETVLCRLRAYNHSCVAVYQVELRCRFDAAVEILSSQPQADRQPAQLVWRLPQLRPGEVREFTLRFRPLADGPIRICSRIRYEHGVCVETTARPESRPTGQAVLELRKEGPTQAAAGQSLPIRLIVWNRGSAAAEEVVLVDELPEGLEHSDGGRRITFFLGRVAPGQQRVVEYHLVARQPGQWTNRATVRARGGVEAFASQTITVAEPKLSVQIEAPPQTYAGTVIPLRLAVSNTGELPLPHVRLEYRVPESIAVLETHPPASRTGQLLVWSTPPLRPQEKFEVGLQLRPTRTGVVNHTATARSGVILATAHANTQVLGAAGLLLVVVDTDDPVLVGQDTRYHLIVRNQGSAAATNIRLRVVVPEEFAITRVQGPSDHQRDGQKLLFEPLHLPPNTDRIYRIYVRALKPGVVRLRVEMTADQLPAGPVRAEESTTILDTSGL